MVAAFNYQEGVYDVVLVTEINYVRCSGDHPLRNNSRGSSYTIRLAHVGWYYFICSRGEYCQQGMKLAIKVEPLPSEKSSGVVSARAPWAAAVAAVFAVLIW